MARIAGLAFLVLGAVFCNPAALRADETTYPIKLTRPKTVGQKFKLDAQASRETTTTIETDGVARPAQTKSLSVAFQGVGEVLEVGKNGLPSKMAYTVISLKATTPDGVAEALPKDAVVTAELKDAKTEFTLKEGTLTDTAKEALRLVGSLDGSTTYDQTYGTDKPRKIGESWDANAVAMADDVKKHGMAGSEMDLSGKATFLGIKKVGNVTCLEIKLSTRRSGFQLRKDQLPPGATTEKSQLTAAITGLFPIDQALPPVTESVAEEYEIQCARKATGDAPALRITQVAKVTHTESTTLVK